MWNVFFISLYTPYTQVTDFSLSGPVFGPSCRPICISGRCAISGLVGCKVCSTFVTVIRYFLALSFYYSFLQWYIIIRSVTVECRWRCLFHWHSHLQSVDLAQNFLAVLSPTTAYHIILFRLQNVGHLKSVYIFWLKYRLSSLTGQVFIIIVY